jgi:hypothetical protein
MIGIFCTNGESETAREFFELFKTPWEFSVPGRYYEVAISSLFEIPAARADLTIIFSSTPTMLDTLGGTSVDTASSDHLLIQDGTRLPIYGKLARLRGPGQPLIRGQADAEIAGLAFSGPSGRILRVGYDLFREAASLLAEGQPVEEAPTPALDVHIALLREWIAGAGIPLVEIPPIPWGHNFIACLTHDVDFVGVRRHKLDHTMWGFVYRALAGSLLGLPRGAGSVDRLVTNWAAALSLPFVYLGVMDDFWEHFDRYAELENGMSSTFFLIPFKHRVGDRPRGEDCSRRATQYDIGDVCEQVQGLVGRGFEIGLHGIDAWHSVEKGEQELARIEEVTGQHGVGVRMHWLWFDRGSPLVLEQAGFDYDATSGYNETIGYKAGTTQVFRPFGTTTLLELPLHIQDTALFFPSRLGLTDAQAWELCASLLDTAARFGGVLTVSWHERSLAPERLWGGFYEQLLHELSARGAFFGTAQQVVRWFRARRSVVFEDVRFEANMLRLRLKYEGGEFLPRMVLRVHWPGTAPPGGPGSQHRYVDFPYSGESLVEIPLD